MDFYHNNNNNKYNCNIRNKKCINEQVGCTITLSVITVKYFDELFEMLIVIVIDFFNILKCLLLFVIVIDSSRPGGLFNFILLFARPTRDSSLYTYSWPSLKIWLGK